MQTPLDEQGRIKLGVTKSYPWQQAVLRSQLGRIFAVCLGTLLGIGGHAALAQDTDDLQLDVTGQIAARCEILNFGAGDATIDLEAGGTKSFGFDIDCNLPMRLELSSKNGALVNEAMQALAAKANGWVASIPYRATVAIDSIGFSETADSADLLGGIAYSTGSQIPFETNGELTVELEQPAGPLPAGRYEDVITITVSADAGAGV